jgi:uncharacterized membrane protein YfbV (UPF0208 family)
MADLVQTIINNPNSDVLTANTTSASTDVPANVDSTNTNAQSPYADENHPANSPSNVPNVATGNATNANTGIKNSNRNVKHVCNLPIYVQRAIAIAGAMGGQIILEIRGAIKAVLAALGITPGSNGITQKIKQLANYIKDITKFVNDMTNWVNGLVVYVQAIQQLITYILSLPAQLLQYFNDCLQKAYAELKKAYLDTVAPSGGDSFTDTINAVKDVMNSTSALIKSTTALAAAPANVLAAGLSGSFNSSNTAAQQAATNQVFAAAGFGQPVSNNAKP